MTLTILGNNSAIPFNGRHPTAQILNIDEELFLIDCGEGTQIQLQKYYFKHRKITHIFISHLHGDHYFGLIGLICSMGLSGRKHILNIYGPEPLQQIIQIQLNAASVELPYPIVFHLLKEQQTGLILSLKQVRVYTFPVTHRIPCQGFVFEMGNASRKLNPDACRSYEIPQYYYNELKAGNNYIKKDGTVISNELLTLPAAPFKNYAYCADTLYTEHIIPFIKNADVIYHESTYLERDENKASERYHSTAKQAAKIALLANAKKLLLGHYSTRYTEIDEFISEAQTIFPNVQATIEGNSYHI